MGSTTVTSKQAGRPRRRSTQWEWKPKRKVIAMWVPKKTNQDTTNTPEKGDTENQVQEIAPVTKFK
jgi:hypothetical protein